jgi:hypothetical protein
MKGKLLGRMTDPSNNNCFIHISYCLRDIPFQTLSVISFSSYAGPHTEPNATIWKPVISFCQRSTDIMVYLTVYEVYYRSKNRPELFRLLGPGGAVDRN